MKSTQSEQTNNVHAPSGTWSGVEDETKQSRTCDPMISSARREEAREGGHVGKEGWMKRMEGGGGRERERERERERYLAGRAKHFDTSSCSASRLWHITACVCERDEAAPTSRLIYCRSTDGPSVCVCVCVCVSVKNIKKRKICTLIETQSTEICCMCWGVWLRKDPTHNIHTAVMIKNKFRDWNLHLFVFWNNLLILSTADSLRRSLLFARGCRLPQQADPWTQYEQSSIAVKEVLIRR